MEEFFNIDISQISVFSFVGLIIWCGLLYGFLWLFKNYLVLLIIKSPVRRKNILNKLPAIITLIWVLFALYALYLLVSPFPFLGVVLSLVFIYLSRGYLINLIHGLFFRLKGDMNLGREIAFDSYQGTILKLNNFDFQIQNKEGEIILIPYSTMVNEEVIKKDFSSDFSSYKFSIKTNSDVSEKDLRIKLLQSPWITPVFPFSINKVVSMDKDPIFDIIVYAIDEKYHSIIERDLKMDLLNE